MKQFKIFAPLLFALLLVVCFAAVSDAAVKITVKNNRDHTLSLAFRWSGLDWENDRRFGWRNVKAGETKTFTFEDAIYVMTSESFGYYAQGGKKVWAGKASDEYMGVIINPKSAFGGHPDDPINGGKKVYFRRVNLKETGNSRVDGSATLTFNP